MRYIDELPDGARAQLLAQREAAMHGDAAAQAHLAALGGSYWGAPPADLFDALAVGIARDHRGDTLGRAAAAVIALFGEDDVPDVVRLCGDVFEEIETVAHGRLDRILRRIARRRSSDEDVAWLLVRAESLPDDVILTADPFGDCSDDGAREISRQVVRARREHTCHWTRRTIRRGERHLVIRETYEGAFTTTRHSLLAVYLDIEGQDPAAAADLGAAVETRRAA